MTVRCSVSTDEEPDYIELDFAKDRRGFRYSTAHINFASRKCSKVLAAAEKKLPGPLK